MARTVKRIFAALAAAVLSISLVLPAAASAASQTSFSDSYDYFTDKYPSLTDKSHVFHTAEYYQFYNYFLGGTDLAAIYGSTPNATVQPFSGKYVFLLGGAWSAATQAAIGYVDEVAKEYGVTAVYNFDPKLDGEGLDISTNSTYQAKYQAILDKLGASSISYPSVIVYQKDSVTTGHIVSSYTWTNTSFANAAAVDAFKAALRTNAFDPAAVNGKIENIKVSDSDYVRSVLNARYFGNYGSKTGDEAYKAPLKPLAEGKDNVYEIVTLNELRGLLASEGNYAILFGGLWCHNTWAVAHIVEQYAEEYGIHKIYFYDTVLDSANSSTATADQLQTRSTAFGSGSNTSPSPIAHLYVDLINDFLPNLYTLNQGEADAYTAAGQAVPASKYITYTNGDKTVSARRLQLPNFVVYNKDHKDAQGNRAPGVGQVEIMTELWNTDPAAGTDDNQYNAGDVYTQYTVGYNRPVVVKDSQNNPIYTYTYWAPGLNQVLGAFIGNQLGDLIAKARAVNGSAYTADSYAALTSALASAKTLKAQIDTAVAAQSPSSTVPAGSVLIGAYDTLNVALRGLKAAPANPATGSSVAPWALAGLAAAAGAGSLLLRARKAGSAA